jgi:hypothetical protein
MRVRSLLAATALIALALSSVATAIATAKPVKETGTSYVSVVRQSGKTEYAAGYSFDSLRGQVGVTYLTTVTTGKTGTITVVGKRVTIWTPTGSLWGTGTATQNLATGAVTNGKLKLTHGTGALKGHSFVGTFKGSFNATSRVFTFHYAGTYR